MYGGVIYGRILDQLIPNWWEEAPIQRWVTRRATVLMTGDRFSVNEALMYSPEAVTLIEREGVDADEGDQDAAILEKVREVAREVVRKKGQIPLPELPDRYDLR